MHNIKFDLSYLKLAAHFIFLASGYWTILSLFAITNVFDQIIGHWLDPYGEFLNRNFPKAQCLAMNLQHVSPLPMAALNCNRLLHSLPHTIFDNLHSFKTSEKCKR